MNTHTIDWLTLKHRWLSLARGETWRTQPTIGTHLTSNRLGFVGATTEQTSQWVERGYDLPGFSGGSTDFAPHKRRRALWHEEEGAIDTTRALCGEDRYRLHREKRDARHGAKVEIGYGFRANISPQVIGQYGKFVAGIIRKLEAEGLDVEVSIVSRSINYIHELHGNCELKILVKRINERADFRAWSALFAPSAHRHLIFTARTIHADDLGKQAKISMGGSIHNAWSIRKDGDTIKLDCRSTDNTDPTTRLEAQAKKAGIL